MTLTLQFLDSAGVAQAQAAVTAHHYLHKPVSQRASVEGYAVLLDGLGIGYFVLGRPQAPDCDTWYGDVTAWDAGRVACTRWQVLNLARIYFIEAVQRGGALHHPHLLPGIWDWRGKWISTLASTALGLLVARAGFDYLLARPPVFPEEPYQLRWLLSYCDPRHHRGVLYRAAGWELYRTNDAGLQTWRTPLPALTPGQDAAVRKAASQHPRSIAYRSRHLAAATTQQGLLL